MSYMTEVMEAVSLIGEPSKVALDESTTWAPGIVDRVGLAVTSLVQITLDFRWFRCGPALIPSAAESPGHA